MKAEGLPAEACEGGESGERRMEQGEWETIIPILVKLKHTNMTPVIIYLLYLGLGLITALAALRIYFRVLPDYRPMLIFILVLVTVEFIITFMDHNIIYKATENVHYLLEFLLVAWIAKRWNIFNKRPWLFPLLVGFILACWTTEKLVTGYIHFGSWCRILCSLLIALLGIEMMSRTLLSAPASLARNTVYLFSRALILYYVLVSVAESYLLILRIKPSHSTLMIYFYFTVTLGAITFILYFKAILCTPKRPSFSMS